MEESFSLLQCFWLSPFCPRQNCVTAQDNTVEEDWLGRLMAVTSARQQQPPGHPIGGLSLLWCLDSPGPLPLAAIYGCVTSVLFFTWRDDGVHLLIQMTSASHCFLGNGVLLLSVKTSFLLTSLLGKQTPDLDLVPPYSKKLRKQTQGVAIKARVTSAQKLQWLCRFSYRLFSKWHFVESCYPLLCNAFQFE